MKNPPEVIVCEESGSAYIRFLDSVISDVSRVTIKHFDQTIWFDFDKKGYLVGAEIFRLSTTRPPVARETGEIAISANKNASGNSGQIEEQDAAGC